MIFLPGAFGKTDILLITLIKKFHKIPRNICLYDGVDNSIWNGGKPNILCSSGFDLAKLQLLNKKHIGVYLTFNNLFIDNVNLKHENQLLEYLNESPLNGVILANFDLYKHIANNYKNLKLSLSVSWFDSWDYNKYNFSELEDQFDYICPMYTWALDEGFIKKAHPKKYKIMLNDTCKVNCPLWHEHFVKICELNRQNIKDLNKVYQDYSCLIANSSNNPDIGWTADYNSNITCYDEPEKIKLLKSYGFTNFKVNGRDYNNSAFINLINEYLDLLKC